MREWGRSILGHSCGRCVPFWSVPLLIGGLALAQEFTVQAQVDKTEVARGESLVFSIVISGSVKSSPKVEMGSFPGFEVVSSGQSQKLQMRAGEIEQSWTLSVTLAATEVGPHTLGPAKVDIEGKVLETQPVEVKVVEGQEASPPARSPKLQGGVVL